MGGTKAQRANVGATEAISFTLYGAPVAQGRGKAAVVNGHVRVYDPKRSRDFKRDVKLAAQEHVPERLLTGPLVFELKIYQPIPKSFSKRKREAALFGELRPTTRPDLKNLVAGVEDALIGVLYADDSQVVAYGATGKWYGDPPRIEVRIWEIGGGQPS